MLRAILAGAVMLATYSEVKQALLDTRYFKDGILTYFTTSLIGGLATAIVVVPADTAKTRMQDMRRGTGTPVYKNVLVSLFGCVPPYLSQIHMFGSEFGHPCRTWTVLRLRLYLS